MWIKLNCIWDSESTDVRAREKAYEFHVRASEIKGFRPGGDFTLLFCGDFKALVTETIEEIKTLLRTGG